MCYILRVFILLSAHPADVLAVPGPAPALAAGVAVLAAKARQAPAAVDIRWRLLVNMVNMVNMAQQLVNTAQHAVNIQTAGG